MYNLLETSKKHKSGDTFIAFFLISLYMENIIQENIIYFPL